MEDEASATVSVGDDAQRCGEVDQSAALPPPSTVSSHPGPAVQLARIVDAETQHPTQNGAGDAGRGGGSTAAGGGQDARDDEPGNSTRDNCTSRDEAESEDRTQNIPISDAPSNGAAPEQIMCEHHASKVAPSESDVKESATEVAGESEAGTAQLSSYSKEVREEKSAEKSESTSSSELDICKLDISKFDGCEVEQLDDCCSATESDGSKGGAEVCGAARLGRCVERVSEEKEAEGNHIQSATHDSPSENSDGSRSGAVDVTACDVSGQRPDLTVSPSQSSRDLTVSPSKSSQDLTVSPSKSSQDLTISPSQSSRDLTVSPSQSSRDLTVNPSKSSQDLTVSPTQSSRDLAFSDVSLTCDSSDSLATDRPDASWRGESSPDVARGESSPDVARGESSPDVARGESSPNVARGESSPDVARGESSPDVARGESSPDVARGESSPDVARGESSPDVARGESSPNVARGESSPDVARGESSPDVARGESSPDVARGESSPDVARGESSPDVARGESSPDVARSESSPDVARGESSPDVACGESSPDVARGESSPDVARGESSPDVARGESSPDVARSESSPDVACGESSPDVARGESSPDVARGESSPDVARGESSPDVARGESSPDVARGESSPDVARGESSPDVARGESSPDVARGESSPDVACGESSPDVTLASCEEDVAGVEDAPSGCGDAVAPPAGDQKDQTGCSHCSRWQRREQELVVQLKRLEDESGVHQRALCEALRERDEYRSRLEEPRPGAGAEDGIHEAQTAEFERTIARQEVTLREWQQKLASHDAAAKKAVLTLHNELATRTNQVKRVREERQKEQGDLVVQYAQAEQRNIELSDRLGRCEAVARDVMHERDLAGARLRNAAAEKQNLQQVLKAKGVEMGGMRREIERLREKCSSLDVTVKWTQNKLKVEVDAHKEIKTKLEETNSKLNQAKEETKQIRKDCQAMIMTYQVSEEIKSNSLDIQLKSKEEELQQHKQKQADKEEVYAAVRTELQGLKAKHKEVAEELRTCKDKVLRLDEERAAQEKTLAKYSETLQSQKEDNTQLLTDLTALRDVKLTLNRERDSGRHLEGTVKELRLVNSDLEANIRDCESRESAHLEFTRRVSDKNARLQSDHITLTNKLTSGETEHEDLKSKFTKCKANNERLEAELECERRSHAEETAALKGKLMERSKDADDLSTKLDDQIDEMKTQKRKHGANMKDLLRQLQQTKRRLETHEARHGDRDSVGMGSRTSSNGSLETPQAPPTANHRAVSQEPATPTEEMQPIVEVIEIDKKMLLDKIIRLQRSQARRTEKMDFLDDHIGRLTRELQAKGKIISYYVMREESGSLTPEIMDINKSTNSRRAEQKMAYIKKGGIMASVYSSRPQDVSMTLELSLQINTKLQAVLEDTLLKNFTLKENIDTLGAEIARLSRENRSIQLQLQAGALLGGGSAASGVV